MNALRFHYDPRGLKAEKEQRVFQKYRRALVLLIIIMEITKNIIVKLVYLEGSLSATTISIYCTILFFLLTFFLWRSRAPSRAQNEVVRSKWINALIAIFISGGILSYQLDFVYYEGQKSSNYEWFAKGTGIVWMILLQEIILESSLLKAMAPTCSILCWIVLGYTKNEEDGGVVALRMLPQWIYIMLIYFVQTKRRHMNIHEVSSINDCTKEALDIVPENVIVLEMDGKVLFYNSTCKTFCEAKSLTLSELFMHISNVEQRSPPEIGTQVNFFISQSNMLDN
jgi:hypothetical protein